MITAHSPDGVLQNSASNYASEFYVVALNSEFCVA
jgi:hypothetical protein